MANKVGNVAKNGMRVHTLVRIDRRVITDSRSEIRAFMTVRNETRRLSQTLDHHRNMDVARFFIVDNGSTDGTREFLLAQPDCHVFLTRNSYAEARFGLEWQDALLAEYGVNHWCLVVDADEWFIYPGCENTTLPELAAYLQQSGAQGMLTFLLDMYGYGQGAVAEAPSEPQGSLLEICRYFDRDYFRDYGFRIPGLIRQRFPPYKVIGGPRWRSLFPVLHRHYNILKAMWFVSDCFKFSLPVALRRAPTLTKIPFLRWLPGTRYSHPHATTPIKLSDVTGVLLHFKFLEDWFARVNIEVSRKEHWDNASEYYRYLKRLKHGAEFSFVYDGSIAYSDSDQLVGLGLMCEDDGWKRIRTAGGP
jgi:glycosyltransferase involved in cell wall biosynthesis